MLKGTRRAAGGNEEPDKRWACAAWRGEGWCGQDCSVNISRGKYQGGEGPAEAVGQRWQKDKWV